MRILITGTGGTLGKYLAESYAKDGHTVIATYRTIKPDLNAPSIKIVKLDLSEDLAELEAVDIVIHAAAHTHLIPNSTVNDFIRSNVTGMQNLVTYTKRTRPKLFIYLSTLSVYGEVRVEELCEDTPPIHPDLYGITKYIGELLLKECGGGIPAVCIRLPGVVGPNYYTPWLGKTLLKAKADEDILIFNPHSLFNNVVDFIELKRFLDVLIAKHKQGFELVNLAASQPVRLREVIDRICSVSGSRAKIVEQKSTKQSFSINIDRVRRVFDYEPESTETIVTRYVKVNMATKGES